MSQNYDNLLIDFNNLNVGERVKNDCIAESSVESVQNDVSTATTSDAMAFCASQPLYKLLNSESPDVEDNNPFDHFDKRACLSDDPFEIVSNAALTSTADTELLKVETGTLISIESPLLRTPEFVRQSKRDAQKSICSLTEVQSVQNASSHSLSTPKNLSPSAKNRSKGKSNSLNLLKYSLSQNRLDMAMESGSASDTGHFSIDETLVKIQKPELSVPRDSSTDDSFDDIWSTKPNLIDSQTDFEFDSDIDSDIAKLNIPMLNVSVAESKSEEKLTDGDHVDDSVETKAVNRIEILEKLASIKQKIPSSPMISETVVMPVHNRTVDLKGGQLSNIENEPVTPKNQYSSVLLSKQQEIKSQTDNPNLLIENLMKLVDKCDDKNTQTTAKHLLDDLSSILAAANNGNENNENSKQIKNSIEPRPPQPIKRQGTFSIEKEDEDGTQVESANVNTNNDNVDKPLNSIDSGLSQVVKQIQNVLGSHQNINVVQANAQSIESSSANPTYIVVMAQPTTGHEENQESHRGRSQSFTKKEKPLAAVRAVQQKIEQNVPTSLVATPVKRPTLQRRSSFGASSRAKTITTPKSDGNEQKQIVQPDAPKVFRRRSLQGPVMSKPSPPIEPEPAARVKALNPLIRRQSTSGIRSPSPKPNLIRASAPVPPRLNSNTTGTRRKSYDLTKDSPQKVKTSYGIMKKPSVPPTTRNLKIRVTQTMSGRSNAPLKAVVPMNRVASSMLVNETVSPVNKIGALITSTPRIPVLTPAKQGMYCN